MTECDMIGHCYNPDDLDPRECGRCHVKESDMTEERIKNPGEIEHERARMSTLEKAIDAVFDIFADKEKVAKLNDFQRRLGFKNEFFSFSSFLDANENRLTNFLDWYFFGLLNNFHPDGDVGGLASYALYDAATPYIDGKPYNLKDKNDFEKYVLDSIKEREAECPN